MKVVLPLHLLMGKRKPKKLPLNLNHYRNAHPATLNNMKILFKDLIKSQLDFPKITEPVTITYTLYLPSRRATDVANVLSIVDKYFCDALVETGVLEDDNYKFLPKVIYEFGEIDAVNPRAEATIELYKRK